MTKLQEIKFMVDNLTPDTFYRGWKKDMRYILKNPQDKKFAKGLQEYDFNPEINDYLEDLVK